MASCPRRWLSRGYTVVTPAPDEPENVTTWMAWAGHGPAAGGPAGPPGWARAAGPPAGHHPAGYEVVRAIDLETTGDPVADDWLAGALDAFVEAMPPFRSGRQAGPILGEGLGAAYHPRRRVAGVVPGRRWWGRAVPVRGAILTPGCPRPPARCPAGPSGSPGGRRTSRSCPGPATLRLGQLRPPAFIQLHGPIETPEQFVTDGMGCPGPCRVSGPRGGTPMNLNTRSIVAAWRRGEVLVAEGQRALRPDQAPRQSGLHVVPAPARGQPREVRIGVATSRPGACPSRPSNDRAPSSALNREASRIARQVDESQRTVTGPAQKEGLLHRLLSVHEDARAHGIRGEADEVLVGVPLARPADGSGQRIRRPVARLANESG